MDKRLVHAVAGAGKTTKLLDEVDSSKRTLILTYTNENLRSLEAGIRKKYGHIPDHIVVTSYFSFLYRFCFRPFISYKLRDRAYTWNAPPSGPRGPGKNSMRHYMTKGRYVYANRVAKLVLESETIVKVVSRLEKHFDYLFIDEVQDFAGNDFNLLLELTQANVETLFVGDFFQHTFDTSRDGRTRHTLHKKGPDSYFNEFEQVGVTIDPTSLDKTHRCSKAVCAFISEELGIPIDTHREDETEVCFVDDEGRMRSILEDDAIVKLFYSEHAKYPCYSNNWGRSKGLNHYQDVCIVLNKKSAAHFIESTLTELPQSTRNKLYVACSRARGNLFFVTEENAKKILL